MKDTAGIGGYSLGNLIGGGKGIVKFVLFLSNPLKVGSIVIVGIGVHAVVQFPTRIFLSADATIGVGD